MKKNVNEDIDPVEFIEYYKKNWIAFIEDACGLKTWSGMRLVCESVQKNSRTSVRACHGVSKTITGAAIAVTFLNLYSPSIVITTAPTGNQVRNLLWKEIGNIYTKQKMNLIGEADILQVRIDPEWYMIGFSTDKPFRMEGFHSQNILWVLDEAKGLEKWLYDAIEGSLTGGFSRVLELSTTDGADQQSVFRQHHNSERSEWNCIKFSAFDSPFVDIKHFAKYKKHVNKKLYKYGKPEKGREWSKELEKSIQIVTEKYIKGKQSWITKRPDLWETKILGDFSISTENNIIPLKWIESAIEAEVTQENKNRKYGLDIARMGNDKTVLTPKEGKRVLPQESWGKKNTMETVGMVRNKIGENEIIQVDMCGLGAGVFDRLAELEQPTIGLDSAKNAFDKQKFHNLRAEMWWFTRELFERQYEEGDVLSIPNDPELIEDLSGLRYHTKSDGKIIVEDKEHYKKRLGRSPDKGDSFVYCNYEPPAIEDQYYGESTEDEEIWL